MKTFAVLNASGSDQVGIVDEFTSRLLDYSCNIEESKMAVLGGEFAMIVLVSGEETDVRRLLGDVAGGALVEGLEIYARQTGPQAAERDGLPYRIESVSLDTPGIVNAVTALLHSRGINIDELETETTGAPFTGAPMFHVRMIVIVPTQVSIGKLRRELAEVGEEHDLDISLRAVLSSPDE